MKESTCLNNLSGCLSVDRSCHTGFFKCPIASATNHHTPQPLAEAGAPLSLTHGFHSPFAQSQTTYAGYQPCLLFVDAPKHLYMKLCLSVGLLHFCLSHKKWQNSPCKGNNSRSVSISKSITQLLIPSRNKPGLILGPCRPCSRISCSLWSHE